MGPRPGPRGRVGPAGALVTNPCHGAASGRAPIERVMNNLPALPVGVVLIGALIAAITDLWKYRVYNALTFPLMLGGLLYHTATGGLPGLGDSLLGLIFGFCSLIVFYCLGGMGAGDVKLMAAVGAWFGMPLTFYVFLASSLAAGAYAIGLLLLAGGLREVWVGFYVLLLKLKTFGMHLREEQRIEPLVDRADRRRRLIPFAAMLFLGVLAALAYQQQYPY